MNMSSVTKNGIDLRAINDCQVEVKRWRERQNFKSGDPIDPLIGVLEEVCETFEALGVFPQIHSLGKMMRAYLKAKQGISGTKEEHGKRYGDALLRLQMSLATGDWDFDKIDQSIHKRVAAPNMEQVKDGLGDQAVYTADFCSRNNIVFGECIVSAWDKVILRDWAANPETGNDPEKIAQLKDGKNE